MIGKRVSHYQVEASIGRGGMGLVYRATDTRLRRAVALKILPEDAGSPARRERFLREAQAASALNHPGIVTIHDVGHDQGVDFIVMEHVEGLTLHQILEDGPLEIDAALGYLKQAASALAAAHGAGIAHRDLKPQNIMVTTGGQLKILDFGLAHVHTGEPGADASTEERLTTAGTVLGTPWYMSPEQADARPVDARTDVFSLGVILYQLLTGQMPFRGTSVPGVLYEIVHTEPEPAADLRPELSQEVRDLLDTMLRKDPEERYANGGEVLEALTGGDTRTRTYRPATASRPRPRWAYAISIIAVGVAALLLWNGGVSDVPEAGSSVAPGDATVYDRYLEGVELLERWDKDDNLETATRLFSEATDLEPSFALAFARLADAQRIQYALTRDDSWLVEASENAEEAMRLNPGLAPVQVALGRIHAMRGNNDLAFAAFERAITIDANDVDAHHSIARLYERLGRLDDAENSFQRAISLDPESISALDSYANFLFRQSRFDDATRRWQAVIRLAPDNGAAFVNLGSSLSESGKIPEAITMYQRAVELNPSYMAYSNLGTAYSRAERYPDAVDAYRKALEHNDKDWLVWGNLGYVYSWMNGMDEQAVRTFVHAIRLAEAERNVHPRDALVHSDLALYYAKTEQPQLALERLDTALALSPDAGEILAGAAEVYELVGQRDKGIEFARKSLENGFSRTRLRRNPELTQLLEDPRMQVVP